MRERASCRRARRFLFQAICSLKEVLRDESSNAEGIVHELRTSVVGQTSRWMKNGTLELYVCCFRGAKVRTQIQEIRAEE